MSSRSRPYHRRRALLVLICLGVCVSHPTASCTGVGEGLCWIGGRCNFIPNLHVKICANQGACVSLAYVCCLVSGAVCLEWLCEADGFAAFAVGTLFDLHSAASASLQSPPLPFLGTSGLRTPLCLCWICRSYRCSCWTMCCPYFQGAWLHVGRWRSEEEMAEQR